MSAPRVLLRHSGVWLHRWVGLAVAAFLILVGLTGSVLAYNTELERIFAPQLFAHFRAATPPLDLATLAVRAQALVPQARVLSVSRVERDQVSVEFAPLPDGPTGRARRLGFSEFFVDPWTGAELGRRQRGDLSEGLVNLMPFVYELHWTLVLGDAGQWVLGAVALAWTLDCFVALYLTLPTTLHAFMPRWCTSWRIKRTRNLVRLNFDVHRASGVWLWPLLFVFAWSSVMMNIRGVYEPVMKTLFDYHDSSELFTTVRPHRGDPRLDWFAAQRQGERLLSEQARVRGFTIGERLGLMYVPEVNAYLYDVRGSRDVFERAPKGGSTSVMFDGDTGALIELSEPTGEHLGNTIESWLYALHMARVFGQPYQALVCVLGIATATLSLTGMVIWSQKGRARRKGRIEP